MIKAGVVGATGYAGSELVRILLAHPEVTISEITSQSYSGKNYGDIFENYRHEKDLICVEENIDGMAERCDVIFLALPHGIAGSKVTKNIISKTKVIDLGADFRLKDSNVYEQWYKTPCNCKDLLEKEAVYGLCEINREKIKNTSLVANPGCYTTCSILSMYPLIAEKIIETDSIIIDAKSGVSGAGRGVSLDVHYNEINESIKAYKLASHRHTPEIEEQLSIAAKEKITLTFTPHLSPMNRGILATCYARLKKSVSYENIKQIYNKFYGDEYFIRLTKENIYPETKWVKGSNFVDIGFAIDERCNRIIVIGAIDNLIKGASGQAVQNMNIMFGLEEKLGLPQTPMFPA